MEVVIYCYIGYLNYSLKMGVIFYFIINDPL